MAENKVIDLKKAIKTYVVDGSHISFGGFTISRNPMAAIYEIIRQGINGLHVYADAIGQCVDELIGAGSLTKLEIAYGGNGRFAPTGVRFRKAVEAGTVLVEDYSNYHMALRFLAGAMGVPFLPTRSSLGTDIINKWGFSENFRKQDIKIPNKKLVVMDNPFGLWCNIPKVVLVPAINTDVAIIHVQKADREGTARIKGLTFTDVEKAKSAKKLIITCEELVDSDVIRSDSDQNQIPFIYADAVVHVPYGAYPTSCYRHYDYDPVYLNKYRKCAQEEHLFREYLDEYVYGVGSHEDLLRQIGKKRLGMIQADRRTGYASNLNRG